MKAFTMHPIQISAGQPALNQDTAAILTNKIHALMPGYTSLPVEEIQEDVFLLPDKLPLTPSRRLVVLVPPGDIAENLLARRVWQLASSSGLAVEYLGLAREDSQPPNYRYRLTSLITLTSYNHIRIHSSVSAADSWLEAVKQVLQPGDVLVCLANQQAVTHFVLQRKLGELLAQATGAPVYMLAGVKIGPSPQRQQLLRTIWAWTATLALAVAFFGIQISIQLSTTDQTTATFQICLSVLVEFYLILKVNTWIG